MARYTTVDELIDGFLNGEFGKEGQRIIMEHDDKDGELVRVKYEESQGKFTVLFEGRVKGGCKRIAEGFGSEFQGEWKD